MKKLNQKGFALALMVPLLPVILAFGLMSYMALGFMQLDQKFKYACRTGGLAGQEKAGKQIEALLKLNPQAQKLIDRLRQAELEQRAGSPKAAAKILVITGLQSILRIRQEQIILQGNLALQSAQQNMAQKLRQVRTEMSDYDSLYSSQTVIFSRLAPRLAVSPDSSDIAPTFRTLPDIENRQALVQNWQYHLRTPRHLRGFLNGDFSFKKSCSVTITEKGNSWLPKIQRDRFL
ncbi:hypothetical protein ACLVWU_15985 [Bdellovibrio sp. HCB290]|uniref:hypothetical protein n=1 Tax=Bdellovibrio sp. HCB290 TaxID=3394356 RepID=UPI0039B6E594